MISKVIVQVKQLIKKGAFHIFLGNFVNKFVGLCGSIFIVRLLSKAEYGTLGYVENLYSYASIFAGLGLSLAILRYNIMAKDQIKQCSNFVYAVKKELCVDVIIIVLVICFSLIYPHPAKYLNSDLLLICIAFALPFQDISTTCLSQERAALENKRYITFSVFISSISVFFRIAGSALGGVTGTIIGRVIAEIISAGVLIYFIYNKYFNGLKSKKLAKEEKKEINIYSFHNMIANGIWVLFMITDVFLIGKICNDPIVLADYKVAYMFPSNMAIIASSIAVFVGPYFVKHENDYEWVKRNYIKTLSLNVIIIGLFALVLSFLSKPLITVVYGIQYLNVIPLMRWLLLAFFINAGIKSITSSLLATMGQAKANMIISIIGFILQISMALYVIPRYGTIGLAKGSVFVYLLMSVMLVVVFTKKYRFFDKKRQVNESK